MCRISVHVDFSKPRKRLLLKFPYCSSATLTDPLILNQPQKTIKLKEKKMILTYNKTWKDCVHVIEKRGERRKLYWQDLDFKGRKRKDSASHFTRLGLQTFLLLWWTHTFLMTLPSPADWEQSDTSNLMQINLLVPGTLWQFEFKCTLHTDKFAIKCTFSFFALIFLILFYVQQNVMINKRLRAWPWTICRVAFNLINSYPRSLNSEHKILKKKTTVSLQTHTFQDLSWCTHRVESTVSGSTFVLCSQLKLNVDVSTKEWFSDELVFSFSFFKLVFFSTWQSDPFDVAH